MFGASVFAITPFATVVSMQSTLGVVLSELDAVLQRRNITVFTVVDGCLKKSGSIFIRLDGIISSLSKPYSTTKIVIIKAADRIIQNTPIDRVLQKAHP